MAIHLYADNACDLDLDYLNSLSVKLFHMPVTIKDNTYRDRLTINPPEFYRLISEPGLCQLQLKLPQESSKQNSKK